MVQETTGLVNNGEFRGRTEERFRSMEEDIREIKERLLRMEDKMEKIVKFISELEGGMKAAKWQAVILATLFSGAGLAVISLLKWAVTK